MTEGTSVPEVSDLSLDWNGNLWIATKGDGLFRFNGEEFYQFTRKDSLPTDYILSVLVDDRKYLWAATLSGLVRFDGQDFETFEYFPQLHNKAIRLLFQSNNSDIYIVNDHNDLFRFDGENFNEVDILEVKGREVTAIEQEDDGNLLFAADGSTIFRVSPNGSTDTLEIPQSSRITSLYSANNDDIWVGTESAIYVIKGEDVIKFDDDFQELYKVSVNEFLEDREGNLWMATSNGLFKYSEGRLSPFGKDEGLTNSSIEGICLDNSNHLWVGAGQRGLYRFSGERFAYLSEEDGMPYDLVTGIVKDKNGTYWMGTLGGGLIARKGKEIITYSLQNNLRSNLISTLGLDQDGNVWFGSKDDGVSVYLVNRKRFTHLQGKLGQVNQIIQTPDGEVCVVHDDGLQFYKNRKPVMSYGTDLFDQKKVNSITFEDDLIYVGTEKGLYVLENGIPSLIPNDRLKDLAVSSLVRDPSGNLWISTLGGGLAVKSGSDYIFYGKKDGLSSSLVYNLAFDSNGAGWLNTSMGLDRIIIGDGNRLNNVIQYGEVEGYRGVGRYSSAVWLDEDNLIWFGTNRGVNIYDALEDNIDIVQPDLYIRDIKLFFEEVDWTRYSDSVDQWFNIPYNLNLNHNQNHLSFAFEGVSLSSANEIQYSYKLEPLEKNFSSPGKKKDAVYTNLMPGSYTFHVKVSDTRGVWNEKELQYSFVISKPFWLHPLFFIMLSILVIGGLYLIFKLYVDKISKANKELEEKISVRTAELYTQKEELKKQKDELEKTNEKLSKAHEIINDQNIKLKTYNFDLENQVIERTKRLAKTNKELFNINKELDTFIYKASHDLLGPLARLKGICNVASMEVEDQTSRKYFNMLNDSAQRTYEILKTLIQLISIRESNVEVKEIDLDKVLKEVINECEEVEGFADVKINTEMNGLKKAVVDDEMLKIILGNLLQNAIEYRDISKHTSSFVNIRFSNGDGALKIEFTDNGIGIDKESAEKIFDMFYRGSLISKGSGLGLYISKVIMRKFGGTIEYSPDDDGNTQFSIRIPQKA